MALLDYLRCLFLRSTAPALLPEAMRESAASPESLDEETAAFIATTCRAVRQLWEESEIQTEGPALIRPDMLLWRGQDLAGRLPWPEPTASVHIAGLEPGEYQLLAADGQVLWSRTLTATDVLIADQARQTGKWRMSARTSQAQAEPPGLPTALPGLYVRVRPGIHSGTLEVSFRAPAETTDETNR